MTVLRPYGVKVQQSMMPPEPKEEVTADFCVIGGGSAGLSFAAGAAQMGASVILLEKHIMGGDCLNSGCVPSKALLALAKHHKKAHPISPADMKEIHSKVKAVIARIAPHDSVERFQNLGVRVIQEHGYFVSPRTVETLYHRINARRTILATGSCPALPPIPGLEHVPYLTNETLFDLRELPSHLVIIGGGPIGCEMAQAFCLLGSQVTILEARSIMPRDDTTAVAVVREKLRREGVQIEEQVTIAAVKMTPGSIRIEGKNLNKAPFILEASHLLVATGRAPRLSGLNLEKAGIEATPRGIHVDERLRTTNSRVYAIGDCIGQHQLTHAAGYHASLAIRNSIFGLRTKLATQALPWVTYTDPECAQVGLTENHAVAQGIPHRVLSSDFSANDRALCEGETLGFIKVIVTPKGHILGATIVGTHAGELIFPWAMAMQNKLKISSITHTIAPYPTLSEISKRAAGQFYTPGLFGPRMRKIVRFLMGLRR